MSLSQSELTTLWHHSYRYCVGRMTYAVTDYCNMFLEHFDNVPYDAKKLILRDLKDEFERDNWSRDTGSSYAHPLGHNCDRAAWQNVLNKLVEWEHQNG
jgi:hypothetical protein